MNMVETSEKLDANVRLTFYFQQRLVNCFHSLFQENENEIETSVNIHSGVLAALSLVGGIDSRPRIGGLITSDTLETHGTLCRISQHGKLVVQLNDSSIVKKLSLCHCKPFSGVQFNLDGIPVSESVLDTWANLLCKK